MDKFKAFSLQLSKYNANDLAGSDIDGDLDVAPRERAGGRRAATSKPAKYNLVSFFLFNKTGC
jgi:hypothetical protein